MQTLGELVRELGVWFEGGPCLIVRLDDPGLRTRQPQEPAAPGPNGAASRPPAPLDALHWAGLIKSGVVALDMRLRASRYSQSWPRALRAIPEGAEMAGLWPEAHAEVSGYHSAALTCLGLQRPAWDMPGVRCLVCGQVSIRCRADDDRPRAWCTTEECVEELINARTGAVTVRRTRYSGDRLYRLTTAAMSGTAPGRVM